MDNLLNKSMNTTLDLDNSFLYDVDENLSIVTEEKSHRWSQYDRPPISFQQALVEYDEGFYNISLYIYMELLVKSTRVKPALREMIDKLLDKDVSLDDIYNCTGSILKVIDNLCKESHYNKAMCMMGISQSLNNIMTKRFHPKIIKSYPTYIRISKIVLKYFRMSVTVLMGCNLELEFDTVNSLNFNLAKIEINYGIMLTSPDVVALPFCKEYLEIGTKALRLGIKRLYVLFQKDPDTKYLLLISNVLSLLNEKEQSKDVLKSATEFGAMQEDSIEIKAMKNRMRSHKHKISIYSD